MGMRRSLAVTTMSVAVGLRWPATMDQRGACGAAAWSTSVLCSGELLQQGFGLYQVFGVKAFRKPVVDLG